MKHDLYTEVTNRIISQLQQGVIPWKRSPRVCGTAWPFPFCSETGSLPRSRHVNRGGQERGESHDHC